MLFEIPKSIRDDFSPTTSEVVVVLEAARILYGVRFSKVRHKFPEIKFEHEPFVRRRDAQVWDLDLGVRLAEMLKKDFQKEQAILAKLTRTPDPNEEPGAGVPIKLKL